MLYGQWAAEAVVKWGSGEMAAFLSLSPSFLYDFRFITAEHPCCSNCGRRTRPFGGCAFREHGSNVGVLPLLSISLPSPPIRRGAWGAPNCARPTRVFIGRALREQRGLPSLSCF